MLMLESVWKRGLGHGSCVLGYGMDEGWKQLCLGTHELCLRSLCTNRIRHGCSIPLTIKFIPKHGWTG